MKESILSTQRNVILVYTRQTILDTGPVRFAEKTSQNTVLADLLWKKNTILAKKQAEKYGL